MSPYTKKESRSKNDLLFFFCDDHGWSPSASFFITAFCHLHSLTSLTKIKLQFILIMEFHLILFDRTWTKGPNGTLFYFIIFCLIFYYTNVYTIHKKWQSPQFVDVDKASSSHHFFFYCFLSCLIYSLL